jgi:monoterpene epsilon-lactone hydrolase
MGDEKRGIMLEKRMVPFPTSVSAEAIAALERLVGKDGTPLNSLYAMPAPEDHEAWRGIKAMADAQYTAAVKRSHVGMRSDMETIKVDDATIHIATPEALTWPKCAYIDLQGGALVFGGGDACRAGARMQADQHGARCYGVDY